MEWKIGSVHRDCPYKRPSYIYVPIELYELCKELDSRLGTEWALYGDIKWLSSDRGVVTRVYLPKQKVTDGSVDVEESVDLPVAIHSHTPVATRDFSATDMEYIVANSIVSLLWSKGDFVRCIHRKRMPCGTRLAVECTTIPVVILNSESIDIDINRILSEVDHKVVVARYVEYGYELTRNKLGRDTGRDIDEDTIEYVY